MQTPPRPQTPPIPDTPRTTTYRFTDWACL